MLTCPDTWYRAKLISTMCMYGSYRWSFTEAINVSHVGKILKTLYAVEQYRPVNKKATFMG